MAKQRRASTRAVRPKTADASPATPLASSRTDRLQVPAAPQRAGAKLPAPPSVSPDHTEAVALYEEGVAALQRHDFSRAASLLKSVTARFPRERELHERVALYLNVCERHMTPLAASPSTPEERVFAATLAVNSGNLGEAARHLRQAITDQPNQDHALYMLASVLALEHHVEEAVPFLLRAIALNPDNRALARHDPDLEALRDDERVRAALDSAGPPRGDRRGKPLRRR